jgi:hypothetical protein
VKPIGYASGIIALAIVAPMLGCTWVPITSEGQEVRILQSMEVTDCKKIGTTTAKTSDRAVFFARTDRKIREELDSLARNEAAELGGDAVVPIGSATDGRQSFDVYRCETP